MTDLATTDVATLDEIRARQEQEFDSDLFQTPILKIGQRTTNEVSDGDASAGEFINTLTGEGLGTAVGFIVSYYQKGRFASDQSTGRAYVAFSDTIPEAWGDFVGQEFVGTPFSEHPDAEEQYKNRVNRKEIEWGSGPPISTTHNFTGLVLVSAPEGSDEEDELQPVRLSLRRTNMPAVRKWITLYRSMRNRPFWDRVFDLSTFKKDFERGPTHLLNVKLGRETTPDERHMALELYQAGAAGRVASNDAASEDKRSEPDAKGGVPL